MSITNITGGPLRGAALKSRARKCNRSTLGCEALETRQLLSAGASAPSLAGITAQANLQVLPLASSGVSGYSPQQIQNAYAVSGITFSGGAVAGNGAGRTIAIVDAYNDPNIASDLATFDSQFGLPAPPSFTVKNLGGSTSNPGWALETSLDVEWAHSIAPNASIVLVEAPSSSLSSLLSAVTTASNIPGVSVVSMSWGTQEFFGEASYDGDFTHPGITYVAASGDSGAWSGPTYPSVSPNVLAVGGTTLTVGANGSYGSETGWSDSTGGFSGYDMNWWSYEPAPSYQVAAQQASGLSYGVRTTPDVSFNANPNTGVAVYDSVADQGQAGWTVVGGTSAAAPAWAGLIAIADQGLAVAGKTSLTTTQTQTELYSLPSSDFHESTSGSNGYNATAGYNLVTGLGSPKANLIVAGLVGSSTSTSGGSGGTTAPVTTNAPTGHTRGSSNGHQFTATAVTTNTFSTLNEVVTATAQQIGALPVQTTSAQVTSSAASVAPSASLTSTASQPSATASNSFGQSLAQQSPRMLGSADQESEPTSFFDEIVRAQSTPIAPGEKQEQPVAPAGDLNPNANPNGDENQEQEVDPAPQQPAASASLFQKPSILPDAVPKPVGAFSPIARAPLAWAGLPAQRTQQESATASTASAVAGTMAMAAGGYWLALKDRGQKRKWLIPGRVVRA